MDALFSFNMLESSKRGNAALYYLLNNIKLMFSHIDIYISHIPKEGNFCADFLAILGVEPSQLTSFRKNELLNHLKGLTNFDTTGLRYIRIG